MYLGDRAHTSFRSDEVQLNSGNISQAQQLWKTSLGATVSAAAIVSQGSIFVGDWAGNFRSLDAATGKVTWSRFVGKSPAPADPDCQPRGVGVGAQAVVDSSNVYVPGGDSTVYALDKQTGAVRWQVQIADPQNGGFLWSSPMLYRNSLYLGIASLTDCPLVRGGLARIPLADPTHPQIRYLVPDGQEGAGIWSTPAIDDQSGVVYVTTGNAWSQDADQGVWGSALLALDADTLEIQAHFFMPLTPEEDDADWGSSPLLFSAGGQAYVAANGKNGMMYVLRRSDLGLVWSYKLAMDCDSPEVGCGSISTPAFDGNILVTGAGQPDGESSPLGMVYAFDPVNQNLLWSYAARAAVLGPVTLTPGLAFVTTTAGMSVLDLLTGVELWSDSAAGAIYSQAVVSNGVLYTTYVNGDVVAWGAAGGGTGGSPGLTVSQTALKFLYTAGGTAPSDQSITVTAGSPATFAAASDSTWLTAGPATATTPAQVAVHADSTGMAAGVYTGNLAFAADGITSVTVGVTLVVNGPLPPLSQAAIGNAASFQPGPLAPGSIFTIFANNLAGETVSASAAPWPTSLSGLTVKLNGIAAPLLYVSPTQVNAQVPYEIPPGRAMLTVESNGVVAGPAPIAIAAAAPGIFTDGAGRAAALNQDFSPNVAGNPAAVGSVISVYFTGQGLVDPAVATGYAAPTDGLSQTLAATTATIGGQMATVTFCGLAPGFVGLGQANLVVPDLPPGDYTVTLNINGRDSNPATITIGTP